MGNAYIDKQKALWGDGFNTGERVGCQKMVDLMQIAMHKKLGLGEKRIAEVIDELKRLEKLFAPAFDIRNDECDYFRDLIDRALLEFCGNEHPLVPWEARYTELKKVKYGRSGK